MKASYDTSWDVEKYRTRSEFDHEWSLKKRFMEAHKGKYEEGRLVCLAQMFINIHFLGCKYQDEVMELIDSLSKEITEKNQKWEGQCFVAASTAVEDKVKSRLNKSTPETLVNKGPINFVRCQNMGSFGEQFSNHPNGEDGVQRKGDLWVRGQKRPTNEANPQIYKKFRPDMRDLQSRNRSEVSSYGFESRRHQLNIQQVVDSGPFGKVVVFQSATAREENPVCVIERTASAAHMTTSFDFLHKNVVECKLSLDGLYLATGEGQSKQAAKESACKIAIERLQETSFTIIVKASFIGSESIDHQLTRQVPSSSVDTPIADSNIGNKLLKLMGWQGGGLGKNLQGIEEPVKARGNDIRRGGLGISNFSDFRRKIVQIIEDFAYGDSKEDLIFSPEFTKEERKVIHELVRKYNLKSRSYGKEEDNRQLVVFKKVRPLEIVEDLMNCGGETEKYKLLPPQSVSFD